MNQEKPAPGTKVKGSALRDSATVGALLDLLHRSQSGGLSGLGRTNQPARLGSDFVMVKNISGAARECGECLKLGDFLLTVSEETTNFWNLWFDGDTPASPLWRCVILHEPAAIDAIVKAHASGVCVAKVDVTSTSHTHAVPVDGSHVLASAQAGLIELLVVPASGGEQLLPVRFLPPIPVARLFSTGGSTQAISSSWIHAASAWSNTPSSSDYNVGFPGNSGGNIFVEKTAVYALTFTGKCSWGLSSIVDVGDVRFEFAWGRFAASTFTEFASTGQMLIPTNPAAAGVLATKEFSVRVHEKLTAGTLIDVRVRITSGSTAERFTRDLFLTIQELPGLLP